MNLWNALTNAIVSKNLRFKKNATITIENSSGAGVTTLSASELRALDGITASAAELNIMDGVTATAAEINRSADVSGRIVAVAVDTAITEALHEGKTVVLGGAGSSRTMTLPAATGGGARYRFIVGAVNTSNYVFKAVVGTDLFEGALLMVTDAGDAVEAFESGATDDTVTLNGTTTGGAAVGDWIEFEDFSATGWAVRGVLTGTGDEVTPFSDSVA